MVLPPEFIVLVTADKPLMEASVNSHELNCRGSFHQGNRRPVNQGPRSDPGRGNAQCATTRGERGGGLSTAGEHRLGVRIPDAPSSPKRDIITPSLRTATTARSTPNCWLQPQNLRRNPRYGTLSEWMETATATGTLSELLDTLLTAIKMLDGMIDKMPTQFNKIELQASNQQNEIEKLQHAAKDEMAARELAIASLKEELETLRKEFTNHRTGAESENRSLFPNHETVTPFVDAKWRLKRRKAYETPKAQKPPPRTKPATPPASTRQSSPTPTGNHYAALAEDIDDDNMDSKPSPVEFPRTPSPFAVDSIMSMNDDLNEHKINALEKWANENDSDIELEMHDMNPFALEKWANKNDSDIELEMHDMQRTETFSIKFRH
jgi:hypothetical protein